MSGVARLLSQLTQLGIRLWVEDGGRLRFEAPKGALTPDLKARLKEHKPAIMELLQNAASDLSAPRTYSRKGAQPLSLMQQGFWLMAQVGEIQAGNNINTVLRLNGPLDAAVLARGFTEIVRRHEVFRTRFGAQDGQPIPFIDLPSELDLNQIDLSAYPEEKRITEMKRLIAADRRQPFDLAKDRLIRVTLLRLEKEAHILLVALHHIIADEHSLQILIAEMAQLYAAFSKNRTSPLAELPLQYLDYACWQREWLTDERIDAQLDYWKKQLAGAPARIELPTDRPRPAVQHYRGVRARFQIGTIPAERLKGISRANRTTLFITLLTAFKIILFKYCRQTDIVVGSPVSNRDRKEFEPLIGLFMNVLVLRTDLAGDPTFLEALARVRQIVTDGFSNQNVPFERVVRALQPKRSLSYHPLFQIVFTMRSTRSSQPNQAELAVEPLISEEIEAQFDLQLAMAESEEGLAGFFELNTDLFNKATIDRMGEHLAHLLASIAHDPNQRLSEIEWLSAEERQRLQIAWNDTRKAYPHHLSLHQLFEQQAARTPAMPALTFDGSEADQPAMTYHELNAAANRLAHFLRASGVGPNTAAGLCVSRSPNMIAAMLAILKAGGAYVPLDPDYPSDRLAYMLSNAAAAVLVTEEQWTTHFPEFSGRIIRLDALDEKLAGQSANNLDTVMDSNHLAYLIYTSGSTGLPKGVMISHRAIGNRVLWMNDRFPMTRADKVLQKTPISFDASGWEIYAPLFSGASLVLAAPDGHKDPAYLVDVVIRYRITRLQLVPSMLHVVLSDRQISRIDSLTHLFCGGEALTPDMKTRCHATLKAELVNLYGPTEASIDVACHPVPRNESPASIPIGRPISNTRIYITDSNLHLTGTGVPGELCAATIGLAQGYLDRPTLTARQFIPNPFDEIPGDRLYRTGDLARRLADGSIEFMGRIDYQIKLRGVRIELGEIEKTLRDHASIKDAVVIVREDKTGEKRLIAYIAADGEEIRDIVMLRKFLAASLPDFMTPARYVFMDAFPRTPSGKLDRRALPEPDEPAGDQKYEPPRDEMEKAIAAIWSEVLAVERVGIHDDFFLLGGHSLMAVQVITRIRETLNVETPLKRLFASPTLAEFAATVAALPKIKSENALPPITPISRDQDPPLSFGQQRLWFLDKLESGKENSDDATGKASYNLPTAVRFLGELNIGALERGMSEIIRRHESPRTIFREKDGQPVQVIQPFQPVTISIKQLIGVTEADRVAEAKRAAFTDALLPFDLTEGPLYRVALLRLSEKDHVLLVNLHHIVSDGWSQGILIEELAEFYRFFASEAGSSPEARPDLPELVIQYRDYAAWQRRWLGVDALKAQLDYWRRQLKDAPTLLRLPVDRKRPPVQTFRGDRVRLELPAQLAHNLNNLAKNSSVTLFTVLHAGFSMLLSRYSGQTDIVVGVPVANRQRKETEGLIGFFLNTLAFRSDFSGNPSIRDLIVGLNKTALAAYERQDLPFAQVVEAIQPDRNQDHSPIFQVLFNLQNVPMQALKLPGLTLAPLGIQTATTKLDLTLELMESDTRLGGHLEYNTDLFDASTIRQMADHFQILLESIVQNPEKDVAEIEILSPDQRRQQLVLWNDTQTSITSDCVHQLFESQGQAAPLAPAIMMDGADGATRISYDDLNRRANVLARRLRARGAGPDSPIGVLATRSPDLIVGLLAILKVGSAYIVLDPGYPRERLANIIDDSDLSLLLTQQGLSELLPEGSQPVSIESGETDGELSHNLDIAVSPDNLAYILYTSGSTGKPKGVMVHHRGLTNYLVWSRDYYSVQEGGDVPLHSSACFDMTVTSLFAPLISGARLVILPEEANVETLTRLNDILHGQAAINFVKLTPSHLRGLARLRPDGYSSDATRAMILGGEALSYTDLNFRRQAKAPRLINEYGPTEATVGCCVYEIGSDQETSGDAPIGQPIANMKAFLLDRHLLPVPVKVAGELMVGGAGLARGYSREPGLSAEKFIPNPFGEEPGARLYRTGDRARRLPCGNIVFMGRIDHQVKLRGFRIELKEIETVLGRHPWVDEAAVSMQNEALHAFIRLDETHKTATVEAAIWREFLQSRLPDYMIPSTFTLMDHFPLTESGKLDRKRLPEPSTRKATGMGLKEMSYTEEILAGIWQEILGLETVSVTDNFLELGGHSLIVLQMIGKVRELFGVYLPIRDVLEGRTLARVAADIDKLTAVDTGLSTPPLVPTPREENGAPVRLPLSFSQQRLWFLDQLSPGAPYFNLNSGLRLEGKLNVHAFFRAISEIIRRHEVMRTRYVVEGADPIQIVEPPFPLEPAIEDLSQIAEPEKTARMTEIVTATSKTSFDLASGDLWRVVLIKMAEETHILVASMHHILTDLRSNEIFIRELWALYPAFAKNQPSPLPELQLQYADYAVWQRQWLRGEVLEAELDYWRERLTACPTLDLATDRPRPAVQTYNGDNYGQPWPTELLTELKALARAEGATLFMTLTAAINALLFCRTGQDDIVVGTDASNRDRDEVRDVIGFFVNQLALRTKLDGDPDFRTLIARVKETALSAYSHQEVPFDAVVNALELQRRTDIAPVFQTKVILQYQEEGGDDLGDLKIKPGPAPRTRGASRPDDLVYGGKKPAYLF